MPAVFARKRRWPLEGQAEADTHRGEEPQSVWRESYRSAVVHSDLVKEYLLQHSVGGGQGFPISLRLTESEARRRFPRLTVMSLGAVAKHEDPAVIDDIRVSMMERMELLQR